MPDKWPIQERIRQLKGSMTYRELSDAIFRKTGKRIGFTALSKLGSGNRQLGRPSTIAILAEYASKPVSWFYEEDSPASMVDAVAEARAEYLAETGDPIRDKIRRDMLVLLDADGKTTPENLRTLATLVEMMVRDAKKDSEKEKS